MSFTAYRLSFPGPLHISDARSDYGKGEKIIHSDTFYAALLASLALVQNSIDADLGCTISSLFPFTTVDDKIIYFFPKPLLQLNQFTTYADIKKLKRIEWIDKEYFEQLLNGGITNAINEDTIQSAYLSYSTIDKNFSFTQTVPRVAVPRTIDDNNGETNIFYIERTYYTEGSGLYFLAAGDTTKLEKSLQLLQHEGIGTDRGVGFGHFTVEKESAFRLTIPDGSLHSISLSLFNPGEDLDILALTESKQAAWEVIRRGGWITAQGCTGIRKRSVYMFTEGSIFSYPATGIATPGKHNLNLKPKATAFFTPPEHEVWRSGRAIFIPIKLPER